MDVQIESIGGMCPVQGYGTIDGERFYLRYRHDCAELYVGPEEEQELDEFGLREMMPDLHNPRLYAEINNVTGEYDRGWLDENQARLLLDKLIELLKPPAEWEHGTGMEQLAAQVEFLSKMMRQRDGEDARTHPPIKPNRERD